MFATLLGALPDPPSDDATAALAELVAAQEAANLEPVTDGRGAHPAGADEDPVDSWRATAALTGRPVKASLRGPWSAASAGDRAIPAAELERAVLAAAERLHDVALDLAAAGCPLVEIEESEAHHIGPDEGARRLFREAHVRLARDIPRTHLSLSIVGGSAWEAGPTTILDPPYHSLAVDLIAGPDNWRLVAVTPADRGIVAGALDVRPGAVDGPEVLIWAARYAASTRGRGLARVGLGTGGSLAHLTWDRAVARLRVLGEAVRIEGLPGDERVDAIDPRAVSPRAAALGRTRHAERKREAGAKD
jgi:methionine synthase II (cobalamin-independent)